MGCHAEIKNPNGTVDETSMAQIYPFGGYLSHHALVERPRVKALQFRVARPNNGGDGSRAPASRPRFKHSQPLSAGIGIIEAS